MTIPANQANYVEYTGDGSTTTFAYNYDFQNDVDLTVWLIDVSTGGITYPVLGTDYTVTGGNGSSGSVVMTVAPGVGYDLFIFGNPVNGQPLNIVTSGALPVQSLNNALDKLTLLIQRCQSLLGQTIHVPEDDHATTLVLPEPSVRAGGYLGFDSDGNVAVDAQIPLISSFWLAILETTNTADALAALGISINSPGMYYNQSILNNQVTVNISGLLLNPSLYTSYIVDYDLNITTSTFEAREVGTMYLIYSVTLGGWTIETDVHTQQSPSGVTFQITGNQVQYGSSNVSGSSYSGQMQYTIRGAFDA